MELEIILRWNERDASHQIQPFSHARRFEAEIQVSSPLPPIQESYRGELRGRVLAEIYLAKLIKATGHPELVGRRPIEGYASMTSYFVPLLPPQEEAGRRTYTVTVAPQVLHEDLHNPRHPLPYLLGCVKLQHSIEPRDEIVNHIDWLTFHGHPGGLPGSEYPVGDIIEQIDQTLFEAEFAYDLDAVHWHGLPHFYRLKDKHYKQYSGLREVITELRGVEDRFRRAITYEDKLLYLQQIRDQLVKYKREQKIERLILC